MADIPEPLQALRTERSRLETLLSADSAWQALRRLATPGKVDPGMPDATERSRLEAELAGNRLYLAWRKLDEAIHLLAPDPVAPIQLVAIEPDSAPAGDRASVKSTPVADSELLRIRGIDEELAVRLTGVGVNSLQQVADFTAKDVRRVRKALELERRISQENWIEQAAMLLRQPAPVAKAAALMPTTAAPTVTARSKPADPPPTSAAPKPSLSAALAAVITQAVPAPGLAAKSAEPVATAPLSAVPAASTPSPLPPAPELVSPQRGPARPSSLTARLFERAPMGGVEGSLLATIHAAENVRKGRLTDALDAVAARYPRHQIQQQPEPTKPVATATPDEPPARLLAPPAAGVTAPIGEPEAKAATAAAPLVSTVNTQPQTPQTRAKAEESSRPVLAPLEEEAEVTIVSRGSHPVAPAHKPVASSAPILPLDSEFQGGEDDDPRAFAAYRGLIEEASVEIVTLKASRHLPKQQ